VPWHRLFNALALSSPLDAFDCFLEHLGLYDAGESPDTLDPTMQGIVENILKHQGIE
jgi:hypothetical protein